MEGLLKVDNHYVNPEHIQAIEVRNPNPDGSRRLDLHVAGIGTLHVSGPDAEAVLQLAEAVKIRPRPEVGLKELPAKTVGE